VVLVVDDDRATAGLIREVLEMEGYPVLHARAAAAGLDIARAETLAVILLDINMPDIDGPEVARRLRADPTTAHIPIVVLSCTLARGGAGIPPEMAHDDRLPKPFALDDLLTVVARWVG